MPFYELAIPATDARGDPVTFRDGSPACVFGLFPIADGESILFGDTFLRSAYVVYDLERREVALAATVFNTSESDVVAITRGRGGVGGEGPGPGPGARSVADGVTPVQTATGVGAPGIARTGTATVVGGVPSGGVGEVSAVGTASPTASPTATKSSAAGAGAVPTFQGAMFLMLVGSFGIMLTGGMFFVWL